MTTITSTHDENLKLDLQKQIDENKFLRDDLNEKNKMIKNLQQRLNDMKKTLQKELKYQSLPNETITVTHSPSSTQSKQSISSSPSNHQTIEIKPSESTSLTNTNNINNKRISNHSNLSRKSSTFNANNNLSNLHDDVNFKYLKHVVLKFVTSREYEVRKLFKQMYF